MLCLTTAFLQCTPTLLHRDCKQQRRWASMCTRSPTAHQIRASASQVQVVFTDSGISAVGEPGQPLSEVASSAGVDLAYGCFTGSCGVCEMELRKFDERGEEGGSVVVRTCVAVVPSGFSRVHLAEMDDAVWGMDGFDT